MYSGPQMVLVLFRAIKVIMKDVIRVTFNLMKDVIRVSAYSAYRSALLARSEALGSSL